MNVLFMYIMAFIALAIGTGAIYLAMIQPVPIKWLHTHYFIRKPINISLLIIQLATSFTISRNQGQVALWTLGPVLLTFLAMVLTIKMHQEKAFPAVHFPKISTDPKALPIKQDQLLAVIDYDGVTKCYPLDYVIHHHVVNDRFGSRTVSLTYCAMCRSIIAYDVTEIGPLFVGSFKNANMVLADVKTKTFFQQATSQSMVGKLHPYELTMIPYQLMTWSDVQANIQPLFVSEVTMDDFKEFELPIPGIWKKIMASEASPGLLAKNRDRSLPARTHVIGILDKKISKPCVYIKKDLLEAGLVKNPEGFILLAYHGSINGYFEKVDGYALDLSFDGEGLVDTGTGTRWDIRGNYTSGEVASNLSPVILSDEYWFSWRFFHGDCPLIRLQ